MNWLKKILFPIFSLFLLYRTVDLVRNLLSSKPSGFSGIETFILAFLLTLFVTGIFAFMVFAYPIHRLLPNGYYNIRNPKALTNAYQKLGISHFKFLLLFFFWGKKDNRKKYFNGTKGGLQNFIFQTKQSEFGHIAAFVTIFFISILLLTKGYAILVLIATGINIIGNAYPVILQRYHRIRIERVLS